MRTRAGLVASLVLLHVLAISLSSCTPAMFVEQKTILAFEDAQKDFHTGHPRRALQKLGYKDLSLPQLIKALQHRNPLHRIASSLVIAELGEEAMSAVPHLIDNLGEGDRDTRWFAIAALVEIGPAAVPALEKALDYYRWRVRQGAAIALGMLGQESPGAIKALTSRLTDRHPAVAESMINALVHIARFEPPIAWHLKSMLEITNLNVWYVVNFFSFRRGFDIEEYAKTALKFAAFKAWKGRVLLEYVQSDGKKGTWYHRRFWDMFVEGDLAGCHSLLVRLTPSRARRAPAVRTSVSKQDRDKVIDTLVTVFKDRRWKMRKAAALGLGELNATSAVPTLTTCLAKDKKKGAREGCARALGMLGGNSVIPTLMKALGDPEEDVRKGVRAALRQIMLKQAVALWLSGAAAAELAAEDSSTADTTAIRKEISAQIKALKDGDEQRKEVAANTLAMLGPLASAAIPALTAGLKDESQAVVEACARALGTMGAKAAAAVPQLSRAMGTMRYNRGGRLTIVTALGNIGADAVDALVRAMGDKSDTVRYAAARSIGHIGPGASRAVPTLGKLLRGNNDDMSMLAALALLRIDPEGKDVVPALSVIFGLVASLENLGETVSDYNELLLIADKAHSSLVPRLITLLRIPNPRAAALAAAILGGLGSRAASSVPELQKLATHPDTLVQRAAKKAIERIERGGSSAGGAPAD